MYCLIVHLVENTSLLDMTEIINIAVSFHWDTCSTFLTPSCHEKCQNGNEEKQEKVLSKVWWGVLLNLKSIVKFTLF